MSNRAIHEIEYQQGAKQYVVKIGSNVVMECRNKAHAVMCARKREGAVVYDQLSGKIIFDPRMGET